MQDYLYEASFISYFNNKMLKPLLANIAREAITEVAVGEIIEEMVEDKV